MKNEIINYPIRRSETGHRSRRRYNLRRTGSGSHNGIASGIHNCVDSSSYSFIGSGAANCIDATSDYSVLAGGYHNCLSGSDQSYSFIAGGKGNTSSGKYTSILGGLGNTITHNYAAVFGNGLVSCSADTFHVSCLNAVNTPAAGGYPIGTVMWKAGNLIGSTDCVLVLR